MPNQGGQVSTDDIKSTLSVTDTNIETVVDFFKDWINSSKLKINNPQIILSDTTIDLDDYSQYSGIMIGIGESTINGDSTEGMAFIYNTKQFLINDDKVYTRYYSNNNWSDWTEVITNEDLDNLGYIKYNNTLFSMGLLNLIYPVGSVYMSFNSTSPATLFGGGTWQLLDSGSFLRAGSGANLGTGNGQLTLQRANLPTDSDTVVLRGGSDGSNTASDPTENNKYLTIADAALTSAEVDLALNSQSGVQHYSQNVSFTLNSTGTQQPISIIPKYQEVYMWRRTA